jgi:hypothetical protein
MRKHRLPINNSQYFGCMTPVIIAFGVYLMFAGSIKRHWSAFARFWWGY